MSEDQSKRPWFKWFPADFAADPALGSVSRAARSLWVEMLGLMHFAEPYGSLLVKGASPSIEVLATLTRGPVKETRTLLEELRKCQVFSVDDNGVIYSRRMRRDFQKYQQAQARGHAGGNPALKTKDKVALKSDDKAPLKAHMPEARGYKPEENTHPLVGAPTSDPGVCVSEAKPEAGNPQPTSAAQPPPAATGPKSIDPWINLALEVEWVAERATGFYPDTYQLDIWKDAGISPAVVRAIVLPALQKSPAGRAPKPLNYWDNPVRDAHAKNLASPRWGGTVVPLRLKPGDGFTDQDWSVHVKIFKNLGDWHPAFGPLPGQPGCRVPVEIQQSYGFLPKRPSAANGS